MSGKTKVSWNSSPYRAWLYQRGLKDMWHNTTHSRMLLKGTRGLAWNWLSLLLLSSLLLQDGKLISDQILVRLVKSWSKGMTTPLTPPPWEIIFPPFIFKLQDIASINLFPLFPSMLKFWGSDTVPTVPWNQGHLKSNAVTYLKLCILKPAI